MLRPYAFVCAPPRLSGYLSFVTAPPTPTERPALPGLRLPLGRRRLGTGAVVSVVAHGLIIVLLIVRGRELLQRLPGALGRGGGGEERAGRPQINFFTLPAAGPTAVDVPAVPAGGGAGGGTGAAPGPGTGGEGGYIFVASPRTAILPPLARVPGSVAGRTYVVKFWVAADGRVTRVEIDPPMADAAYSREFQQRMMAYQFYPARTRDGRNVASIVPVPLRIGH